MSLGFGFLVPFFLCPWDWELSQHPHLSGVTLGPFNQDKTSHLSLLHLQGEGEDFTTKSL